MSRQMMFVSLVLGYNDKIEVETVYLLSITTREPKPVV